MPYPISTLPYPFRRRLRQLVSPLELHQLQVATGSLEDNRDLLPIQTCHSIICVKVSKLDETTIDLMWIKNFDVTVKLDGAKVYNVAMIDLTALNEADTSNLMFNNIITTSIDRLYVNSCKVTKRFLESLSQKRVKPSFLKVDSGIIYLTRCNSITKLSTFFDSFPTLQECYFRNISMSGWVKYMVDYGRTNLKMMTIWDDNFHILFDFKPVKLYQFIKAQKEGFKLSLFYVNLQEQKVADMESRVVPLFSQYFKPCNKEHFSVEIRIQCMDSKVSHLCFTPRY